MIAEKDADAITVLSAFAAERRRAVAYWRVRIVLHRQAAQSGTTIPGEPRVKAAVRRMVARGDLLRIPDLREIYIVESPYAAHIPLSDEQVLQEASPGSFFSHLTAAVYHGLTDAIPRRLFMTRPRAVSGRLPLGTTAEDWAEIERPSEQRPERVLNVDVVWASSPDDRGVDAVFTHGSSIYMTDRERTLLDMLASPDKGGGVTSVIAAWRRGSDSWDVERLLAYCADAGPVARQRVGFLAERLGVRHTILEAWKSSLQRGGSMKLVAHAPYAPNFSSIWNLSLNVPPATLAVLDE